MAVFALRRSPALAKRALHTPDTPGTKRAGSRVIDWICRGPSIPFSLCRSAQTVCSMDHLPPPTCSIVRQNPSLCCIARVPVDCNAKYLKTGWVLSGPPMRRPKLMRCIQLGGVQATQGSTWTIAPLDRLAQALAVAWRHGAFPAGESTGNGIVTCKCPTPPRLARVPFTFRSLPSK